MVKRKNRLTTDAVREVKNTFSRFLSILVLSALAAERLAPRLGLSVEELTEEDE